MKNQTNGLVSILIITYNRPSLLKTTLDSVINQTYDNIEIIVVDDSTNSESEKLCKKYGHQVRYFHRDKRGGIPSALNFGIKQIRGTWIKFLSDDNCLFLDTIETLVSYGLKVGPSILYSDFEFIDETGNELGYFKDEDYCEPYELAAATWGRTLLINGETTLIHKSCLDIVGEFNTSFGSAMDYDWFLRACLIHKCMFHRVPKILLQFRIHEDEASWENMPYGDELLNMQKKRAEKINEKIRKQMIDNNPEGWKKFQSYRKQYLEKSKSKTNYTRKLISMRTFKIIYRRVLQSLPPPIKNLWLRINSISELKCQVCKIRNKQTILYARSSANHLECWNCATNFTKRHIKTMEKDKQIPY